MRVFEAYETEPAAKELREGQILLVPTDTVYGVGVKYGSLKDLERLKNLKKRPETKPVPFMVSSLEMLKQIAETDERSQKIIERLLPGALTLILKRKEEVPAEFTNGAPTIAIRIPDQPIVLDLIEKTGSPLLVTSANISGEPAALSQNEAMEALPNADGILAGICHNQQASTIVDCTGSELKILRQGPVSLEEIVKAVQD